MASGDKRKGGGGVEEETGSPEEEGERSRGEEQGQDGEMKDGGLLSHKLPKALLLTGFLSQDERTLLR